MKTLIFTALLSAAAIGALAQAKSDTVERVKTERVTLSKKRAFGVDGSEKFDSVRTTKTVIRSVNGRVIDSVTTIKDGVSRRGSDVNFSINFGNKRDSTKRKSKAPGFSWGLTFTRFDLGLATLIDNGSTRLSPTNEFLRYRSWKTSNVGFDVFQAGYRFNSTFKMYLAGGFDWELIRLREDITITRDPDQSALKYTKDPIDYSKNRFSSAYLRIPVMFDFRSKEDKRGNNFHYVIGPEFGILLTGRMKQISEENGKQKMNYPYHFTKFRYGAVARIGYSSYGLFAKYYMNDMFDTAAQKGLKNVNFGFTIGF